MFAARKTDNVSSAANYIEECFSTYLYTGTGSSQTITNGIDLSGKGGLVWVKHRAAAVSHVLLDTVRGSANFLSSNTTDSQQSIGTLFSSFNNNGFTVGADNGSELLNGNTKTYASWTFREQAKFFDVVTWTGNGTGNRTIPHSLGSTPGFIQTKRTDAAESWWNHHRSVTSPNANWWRNYGTLSTTNAFSDWGDNSGLYQSPDATNLYIGSFYNASGKTYVAYLFAHDAGGFGATGTDNVISCGSYVGDGTTRLINVGFEPQWILIKNASSGIGSSADWRVIDNMRGFTVGNSAILKPNLSDAETTDNPITIDAMGFYTNNLRAIGETYIYIAIRRGPMKTPTSGTSVFNLARTTEPSSTPLLSPGTPPPDTVLHRPRLTETQTFSFADRLRGDNKILGSANTNAEQSATANIVPPWKFSSGQNAQIDASAYYNNSTSFNYVAYSLVRASGFFDVVCYTGTGSNRTVTHNLGVVPELMIVKNRSNAENWGVYSATIGNTKRLRLNATDAETTAATEWNNTSPTSSVFTVGTDQEVNFSGNTYVAYLFASCPGVSKVGSFTNTGSTINVECGFTNGARFILLKRTNTTGGWFVYDTARGINPGTDPGLALNSTAAEYQITDDIDAYAGGFTFNGANWTLADYIYLAIA